MSAAHLLPEVTAYYIYGITPSQLVEFDGGCFKQSFDAGVSPNRHEVDGACISSHACISARVLSRLEPIVRHIGARIWLRTLAAAKD